MADGAAADFREEAHSTRTQTEERMLPSVATDLHSSCQEQVVWVGVPNAQWLGGLQLLRLPSHLQSSRAEMSAVTALLLSLPRLV